MTSKQRYSIVIDRWPAACRAQGWNPSDRERRLRVIGEAVGRAITTMNDLDNGADIDAVYAHLGALTDKVAATIETLPAGRVDVSAGPGRRARKSDTAGYRRRLFWLVRKHAAPLGGEPYVLGLARDKFHLTAGMTTLEDLTTQQLHQLMMTLAARRSSKQRSNANASLNSEESFPDEVEFEPEPETANCPF